MAKHALSIGINDYPGSSSDLSGCINDCSDWKSELMSRGFDVRTLQNGEATKAAMVSAITNLVRSLQPGDIGVLTYSGHGTWVPDRSGDEADRRDEALCPYDIMSGATLLDDELATIFNSVNKAAKLIMISDSCHSGTVSRDQSGEQSGFVTRYLSPLKFLNGDDLESAIDISSRLINVSSIRKKPLQENIVLISGCKDTEYSYDARFGNRPNGALTYFAIKSLKHQPAGATYSMWFNDIRDNLPCSTYPQTPQLTISDKANQWRIFE